MVIDGNCPFSRVLIYDKNYLVMRYTPREPITMSRPVSNRDLKALGEFRYRIRRFTSFSEQAARSVGLEPQQHQLLLAIMGLSDGGDPTIGELAERLLLQHNSTVELIDRTEQRDLVRRRRNPDDRRQVLVSITPEGEALLQELAAAHWAELKSSGPRLVSALLNVIEGENSFEALPDDGASGKGHVIERDSS